MFSIIIKVKNTRVISHCVKETCLGLVLPLDDRADICERQSGKVFYSKVP